MASPPQPIPPQAGLKAKAHTFWRRVSDGLAVHQLWGQLVKDARSSYRLYSAGLMPSGKRVNRGGSASGT
jgi:hypothetical protein